jgi:hypothetical protein
MVREHLWSVLTHIFYKILKGTLTNPSKAFYGLLRVS